MNHRQIQRTLFRMQLDPDFAARLRAGEPAAVAELGAGELCLLCAADPVAIAADRDGKRRTQFLANVSSEFALSRAAGLDVDAFTASDEFHAAVRADQSLPLAFAGYAARCTRKQPEPLRALVALETALARARRELRSAPVLSPDEVALSPWASLAKLPGGSLELAERLRAALDAHAELPLLQLAPASDETLLVRAASTAAVFQLRAVEVERLSRALARLLDAAREPRTRAALAGLVSAARAELDPVIDTLVADAVLVEGEPTATRGSA